MAWAPHLADGHLRTISVVFNGVLLSSPSGGPRTEFPPSLSIRPRDHSMQESLKGVDGWLECGEGLHMLSWMPVVVRRAKDKSKRECLSDFKDELVTILWEYHTWLRGVEPDPEGETEHDRLIVSAHLQWHERRGVLVQGGAPDDEHASPCVARMADVNLVLGEDASKTLRLGIDCSSWDPGTATRFFIVKDWSDLERQGVWLL